MTTVLHPAIRYQHFETIDSTNTYLMQNTIACPYLVSTDTQTAGHGRRKQAWVDEGKSLLFSFATEFEPSVHIGAWSVQVAITLAQTLEKFTQQQILIKWPNDLYVKNAQGEYGKCIGILTESSIGKQGKMVTGIGINLAPIATDIDSDYALAHLDIAIGRQELLFNIANELYWQWQDFLVTPSVKPIDYVKYDMLSGEMLLATDLHSGEETIGQGSGIDEQGQLLIQQYGCLVPLATQHRIRFI